MQRDILLTLFAICLSLLIWANIWLRTLPKDERKQINETDSAPGDWGG
jgi:hypothetical protein